MSTKDVALAWLRSKKPDQPVGMRMRPGACPMAEFLRSAAKAPDPAVFKETYRTDRLASKTQALGPWAQAAVAAVDESGPRHTWMTASEVIRLWEAIP